MTVTGTQDYLCAVAQVRRPLTVGAVGPLAQGLGELPLLQGRAPLLPGCVCPFHLADCSREGLTAFPIPKSHQPNHSFPHVIGIEYGCRSVLPASFLSGVPGGGRALQICFAGLHRSFDFFWYN